MRRPALVRWLVACGLLVGGCSAVSAANDGEPTTSRPRLPATSTTGTSRSDGATAGALAPGGSTAVETPAIVETTPPANVSVAVSPLLTSLGAVWSRTPAGSCLMVADGHRVLFERNPDRPVQPASTMKLLTATAVLQRLDPASRLRTPVLAAARPGPDGVVAGDLWLVGGGDPVLGTLPWGAHFQRQPRLVTAIEVLADRLVAAGVRHVTGRVVGDEGRYDRERYVPSWPARYRTDGETGPLSALSVDDGFAGWGAHDVPFADPAAGAAAVLTSLLRQRGVVVDAEAAAGPAPSGAIELAGLDSPTVAELVRQMLLDSDNGTAELLVKELGLQVLGRGTTVAGREVVLDTLRRMGLPMDGVVAVDGSGLDPGNRLTCRLLAAILTTSPSRLTIAAGLPVAAQSGTLYKRFLGTPMAGHLRAKTGSIKSVIALAGYADGADGRPLTFVYEVNGTTARSGLALDDQVGSALVTDRL